MQAIINAYGFHILLYGFYGALLVYPDRTWNSSFTGLSLMTIAYNILHRFMHYLPTTGIIGWLNFHVTVHHNKRVLLPRWLELVIEFIFEFSITLCIPVFYAVLSGEWVIPFSIILFTSIFFAMNHVLFYSLLPSDFHEKHHRNTHVNFIPDYLDHLFGTNADETYEDMNQQIPLILISALITHFAKVYFQWKD
jgi:hypothetical protein